MRKAVLSIIGFLALAGIVGYVATSGRGFGSGDAGTAPFTQATSAADKATSRLGLADGADTATAPEGAAGGGAAGAAGGGGLSSIGALPPIGPDIVKTAGISIEVKKGGFETAFNAATTIAGRYGGYVERSSMKGIKAKSGELTIRVPASVFEQAMNDLRGLWARWTGSRSRART